MYFTLTEVYLELGFTLEMEPFQGSLRQVISLVFCIGCSGVI